MYQGIVNPCAALLKVSCVETYPTVAFPKLKEILQLRIIYLYNYFCCPALDNNASSAHHKLIHVPVLSDLPLKQRYGYTLDGFVETPETSAVQFVLRQLQSFIIS